MDLFFIDPLSTTGVVPIVAQAGTALFPAIIAGLTSFIGLLMRPQALLKACAKRPWVPLLIVALGAGIWFWPAPQPDASAARLAGATPGAAASLAAAAPQIDWTAIALTIIDQQAAAPYAAPKPQTATTTAPTTKPLQTEAMLTFRGGPDRRGALGPGPTDLRMKWKYYPILPIYGVDLPAENSIVLASPIVTEDAVFGASCELSNPSTGTVFRLDRESGEKVWQFDYFNEADPIGFFSSPTLSPDGTKLVIGQGLHPDMNCHLLCLDTASGELLWSAITELHIESSPAIADGLVIVGCGAIENPETKKPSSHPGYVMAVDLETGEERWRHDVADPESSPAVVDGVCYIGSGFNGKAVVALDIHTNDPSKRELWKTPAPHPVTGTVSYQDGRVYIGCGNGDVVMRDPNPAGAVMCLDATDGSVIWEKILPDLAFGGIALVDDFAYVGVADGTVLALNKNDGSDIWTSRVSVKEPVLAGVSVSDHWCYAISRNGFLARLDRTDGTVVEKVLINDEARTGGMGLCISSPTIVGQDLVVGSETGGLRLYRGRIQ